MSAPGYSVVCICAEWCHICGEYRPGFFALAREFPEAAFSWLDTEDDAGEVGDLEIENFPTLLVKRGGETLFFGPQPPSHDILKLLLQKLIRK